MGQKKNVMLTCLSPVRWTNAAQFYAYEDKREFWPVEGYNTNEAPIKRVIEILHREGHGERLDRVVMICSTKTRQAIGQAPEQGTVNCAEHFAHMQKSISAEKGSLSSAEKECGVIPFIDGAADEAAYQRRVASLPSGRDIRRAERGDASAKPLSEITHTEYYKELLQHFAETVDESYREHRIEFEEVEVNDFLDEREIALAVTSSASKVMGAEDEDIDLYVEYNGGPRIVTALELILCNLMKLRKKVNLCEMTYMDFDNKRQVPDKNGKEHSGCIIQNMNEISECMDLVSGINEYVNYGRTRTLKEYFKGCGSERIQNILAQLERFANNMQMCLTDYIIESKESVRRALEEWQEEYRRTQAQNADVYELMFSFVAGDILEGCRPLLEGSVPRMVAWCVEKGFIWQAMLLYEHEMPGYFIEQGIFAPTPEGRMAYLNWLDDQLQDSGTEKCTDKNISHERKYTSYYWLNRYLAADHLDGAAEETLSTSHLDGAAEKARQIMTALEPEENRAMTGWEPGKLFETLKEYFEIQSQCRTPACRVQELGDRGELWSYEEMEKRLTEAVERFG